MPISENPWTDPELLAIAPWLAARGLANLSPVTSPLAECRTMIDRIGAALNEGSVPLADERDVAVPAPQGAIPCRLYRPDGIAQPPLLVYAHGGSFALGSLTPWDAYLRDLVRASGAAVLAVDYRLAPEHRFPAGSDDMIAVARHAAAHGELWGTDASRLAIGGDSAGANLALGAAIALRDAGASPLRFMMLVYGAYAMRGDTPSWQRLGTGRYGLSTAQLAWIHAHYFSRPEEIDDRRASPLGADLHGLPPAHMLVGTLDPLLDENHLLAQRLSAAGVPNTLHVYAGLTHGFIRYGRMIRTVGRAVEACAVALRHGLAG